MKDEFVETKEGRHDLRARTRTFAVQCVKLYQSLQPDFAVQHFGRQLLRSATSVAANYRAACRARSDAELHSKLCICEEEADECDFWFDMLEQVGVTPHCALRQESNELTAMFVSAKKRLRSNGLVREDEAVYGIASETLDNSIVDDLNFDLVQSAQPSSVDLRTSTFDL